MSFENFDIIDWIVLSVLGAMFLAQILWYICLLAAPMRKTRKSTKDNIQSTKEMPAVSVILCAHNEEFNLSQYLPVLLTQDYPEYEIIVVDDGSEDDTRTVVESFMARDKRIHLTFVPYGARVGSTKKLALTLAAKAAQYDYLLLTDADCTPESRHWIAEMMAGFKEGQTTKDIVLGFGAYFSEPTHVNRLVQYDTLFNGLHYLGAALWGMPYMGVGRNLAYRKALFFDSGGFSHLMTNRAGDDDLFVNHVATSQNTAVVLSPKSLTWSPAKRTLREWFLQKRRHLSVSPSYKLSTKMQLLFEPLTRGIWYLAFVAAIVYAVLLKSFMPLSIACGLFLLRWAVQGTVINLSARRLGLQTFRPFTILWFDIVLPLVNLWMLAVPQRNKNKW